MKKHILLIDDDHDELIIFMDALNQVDGLFKCTYANSADQAIEMLTYVQPEFIFVDYNLPKINGMQFLSALKTDPKQERARVFLYSTKITEEVKQMAKNLGATGCIEKTNTIGSLTHQLKVILNSVSLPN